MPSHLLLVLLLSLFPGLQPRFQTAPQPAQPQVPQPAPTATVVAAVDDDQIFDRDLIASQQRVRELQQLIASASKDQVEVWIANRLIQQEIEKRSLSYNRLIDEEVIGKTPPPTDEEGRKFFEANQSQFPGDYPTYRDYVLSILLDQRQRDRMNAFVAELRTKARVSVSPPGEQGASAVLATVNNDKVTATDLEDTLKQHVYGLELEIFRTRSADIELKIGDKLFDHEAKRRGVTSEQLTQQEIVSKARKITDDDVVRFFVENGNQINDSFQNVKPRIESYLREQALQDSRAVLLNALRGKARIQIFLTEPEPPPVRLTDASEVSIGRPGAPVTITEFTDYQCPTCARAHAVISQVLQAYGDKVRLVVRNLPLYIHENAQKAAEAVLAANAQGKYRQYAELLYQNQNTLSLPFLKAYASTIGVNQEVFDSELDGGKYAPIVARDTAEADRLNVHSTPTFFINKRILATGQSLGDFQRMIDRELARLGINN